ncbi:MAG TPA: hypothetical protein VGD78_04885 [Chthoniobacterales bacterium]
MFWERDFRPYVSAAEQRERAEKAARKLAKKGQTLTPVHVEGRNLTRTFWGKSWGANLEAYSDYQTRLPRGRSYVRNGCVLDLQISPGVVKALVQGTQLYRGQVTIAPVPAAAWKALKGECSRQVGSLMDLLQGKLSASVMAAITQPDTGLFPKPSEIRFECSCPDWAGMCKHVAAALYGIGTRLDQSPELLFVLRQADHLELISDATASVTAGVATAGPATLASDDLAQVFGIEVEPLAPSAGLSVKKSGKPASPKSPRRRPSVPAKRVLKSSAAKKPDRSTAATPATNTIRRPKKAKPQQRRGAHGSSVSTPSAAAAARNGPSRLAKRPPS